MTPYGAPPRRDPLLRAGLVVGALLCVACYLLPVTWVVTDLLHPEAEYAGLGLFLGLGLGALLLVPSALVLVAWVVARRGREVPAAWTLLPAAVLLLLGAPGVVGFSGVPLAGTAATVLGVATVACCVATLVRARRTT